MHISILNPSALQVLPPSTVDADIERERETDGEENTAKVHTGILQKQTRLIYLSCNSRETLYRHDLLKDLGHVL